MKPQSRKYKKDFIFFTTLYFDHKNKKQKDIFSPFFQSHTQVGESFVKYFASLELLAPHCKIEMQVF